MGRPALGKVVYKRRVYPEWVERLDAFISTNGAVRDVGYGKAPTEATNGLESKGMGGYGPVVDAAYKKISDDLKDKCVAVLKPDVELALLKREVDVLKNQLSQMTKSYEGEFNRAENLVIDLGNAKDELEQVAGWTEDEKTRYWRGRALQAELTLKGKTNEFDQG